MTHPRHIRGIVFFYLIFIVSTLGSLWSQRMDPTSLGFKKKFMIEISNPGPLSFNNHPIILNVEKIRESFPDFNTSNYAIFEETGRNFRLVVSQPDDLDKDRIHDEIVLIRSLPASSATTLQCYYSPEGSFQLMATPRKAATRLSWDRAKAAAGWESNLCAYSMVDGQLEFLSKFNPDLVLNKLSADFPPRQDWGMAAFDAGDTSGLGGLSLWEGSTRIPLAIPGGRENIEILRTVISSGPLRALVKVDFTVIRSNTSEKEITLLLSAFADNSYSRQDVSIRGESLGNTVYGLGIQKLADEDWIIDKEKGFAGAWGKGVRGAGEIGLAVVFDPDDYAGLEETGSERFIRLQAEAGTAHTYWILGGWEKGILAPLPPKAKNWTRRIESLAGQLLSLLEIRFKPF